MRHSKLSCTNIRAIARRAFRDNGGKLDPEVKQLFLKEDVEGIVLPLFAKASKDRREKTIAAFFTHEDILGEEKGSAVVDFIMAVHEADQGETFSMMLEMMKMVRDVKGNYYLKLLDGELVGEAWKADEHVDTPVELQKQLREMDLRQHRFARGMRMYNWKPYKYDDKGELTEADWARIERAEEETREYVVASCEDILRHTTRPLAILETLDANIEELELKLSEGPTPMPV